MSVRLPSLPTLTFLAFALLGASSPGCDDLGETPWYRARPPSIPALPLTRFDLHSGTNASTSEGDEQLMPAPGSLEVSSDDVVITYRQGATVHRAVYQVMEPIDD